jgi:hypothetical protein
MLFYPEITFKITNNVFTAWYPATDSDRICTAYLPSNTIYNIYSVFGKLGPARNAGSQRPSAGAGLKPCLPLQDAGFPLFSLGPGIVI